MIKNNKYFVAPVNSSKANKFTEYYHYTHIGFRKASLNLGVYDNNSQALVGVMQWGHSAAENIKLNRYVKDPITKNEYFELNRFCMADTEGPNSESQALALGIKWIKKNCPNIKLLVSYAGRREGHVGYIYQATNWEYLGYFISSGFWRIDGQEVHQISLWYYYNHSKWYNKKPFMEALMSMYSSLEQTWTKQFIYVQRLDKNLILASKILPYPKVDDGPIVVRTKVYQGESTPDEKLIYHKRPDTIPQYTYDPKERLFKKTTYARRNNTEIVRYQIASYDSWGRLIECHNKLVDYLPNYLDSGIRKSYTENKFYKDRLFKKILLTEDPPEEIEVPVVCIIDEIPFRNLTEASKYLNVSRQAVSLAKMEKRDHIGSKEIIWIV